MNKKLILFGLFFACSFYALFFLLHKPFNAELPVANKQTTALCIEAQTALGIPADKQAKIYQMDPTNKVEAGITYRAKNGLRLDKITEIKPVSILTTYGAQRYVAFHEAAHVKYHDQTKAIFILVCCISLWILLFIIGCISSIIIYRKLPQKMYRSFRILVLIGLFYISFFIFLRAAIIFQLVMPIYIKKCEQRADLTAIKAIECTTCLKSMAAWCSKRPPSKISAKGYLSAQEILEFGRKYNAKKYCTYHTSLFNRMIESFKRCF